MFNKFMYIAILGLVACSGADLINPIDQNSPSNRQVQTKEIDSGLTASNDAAPSISARVAVDAVKPVIPGASIIVVYDDNDASTTAPDARTPFVYVESTAVIQDESTAVIQDESTAVIQDESTVDVNIDQNCHDGGCALSHSQ